MSTYIPQLVDRTADHLKMLKFNLFLEWALKNGFGDIDAQYLVSNQALYNWFNVQIKLIDEEFIRSVANENVAKKSTIELFSLYLIMIKKIHQLYPKKLLNNVRRTQKTSSLLYLKFNLN